MLEETDNTPGIVATRYTMKTKNGNFGSFSVMSDIFLVAKTLGLKDEDWEPVAIYESSIPATDWDFDHEGY